MESIVEQLTTTLMMLVIRTSNPSPDYTAFLASCRDKKCFDMPEKGVIDIFFSFYYYLWSHFIVSCAWHAEKRRFKPSPVLSLARCFHSRDENFLFCLLRIS
jgi:hypothetical protein